MAAKRQAKTGDGPKGFDAAASRVQWLKGVLEIVLLGIISRGEAYGYEIGQQLEESGLGTIKGGTLYPRLAALEAAGLVEVEWRVGESGPGRKYYRATAAGVEALAVARVEYRRFGRAVEALLYGSEALAPEGLAAPVGAESMTGGNG